VSSLAADLVNTRPRDTDPGEKLTGSDAVAALLAPYGLPAAPVEELRALRSELLPAFEAHDMGELAATLNPLLARGAALRLLPAASSPAWALRAPTDGLSAADVIAVAAATELATLAAERGLDRLGFCAADDCQAVFADTSPRGDRHYCSRRCSTRMNVRRFRKQ
jgi:predicted RNA-binding Zn ribbon-like protein